MSPEVLVALISLAGTVTVAVLSYLGTLRGARQAQRESTALIAWRLQQLEDKVNRHNSLVERTFRLEARVDQAEQRLSRMGPGA